MASIDGLTLATTETMLTIIIEIIDITETGTETTILTEEIL